MKGYMYNKDGKLITSIKDIAKQKDVLHKVVLKEEENNIEYELVVGIKEGYQIVRKLNKKESPIEVLKRTLKEYLNNKYIFEKTASDILETKDEEIIALLNNLETFVENGYKLIGVREYKGLSSSLIVTPFKTRTGNITEEELENIRKQIDKQTNETINRVRKMLEI